MTKNEILIEVYAKPRAKRSAILGVRAEDGALEVAIAAPPADGAANAELVALLSAALGVPKRDVRIARGESSRRKLVGVTGLDASTVRARLAPTER